MPHENVVGPGNVARLRLLWNVPTGLDVDSDMRGSPVVANGLVYVLAWDCEGGHLLALDAATEVRRSTQPSRAEYWCGATPAVAQGRVVAPAQSRMMAFDARTGAVRWRSEDTAPDCPFGMTPTVMDGKLFSATFAEPRLEARNAVSGRLL